MLGSKTIQQPLPHCLPKLLPTLKKLHTLALQGATVETLTATLPVLTATPTTLKSLSLAGSKFNLETMQVMCFVLSSHSKSMTALYLHSCEISDEKAQFLTAVLHRLKRLDLLDLRYNDIHNSGIAIAEALLKHTDTGVYLYLTDNPISASGRAALTEFEKKNKPMYWLYC